MRRRPLEKPKEKLLNYLKEHKNTWIPIKILDGMFVNSDKDINSLRRLFPNIKKRVRVSLRRKDAEVYYEEKIC